MGTALAVLSYAVAAQSLHGYLLTAWVWVLFKASSVYVEVSARTTVATSGVMSGDEWYFRGDEW